MARNITLSADADLIERARERARKQETTLNAVFRQWLASYVAQENARGAYERLMSELDNVSAGRSFTREELNER